MESVTKTESNASRSFIPVIAVVGGIVAIVSLFIYWVDISTTFSYSFFEIPYTMKATAIKVVEGSTDIPDDWHIYCPALAGVFAVIGAIIGIAAIAKKGANKAAYAAIIICGLLAIQFAVLFAAWNFDVMYTVTESDSTMVQGLATVLGAANGDPTAQATIAALISSGDPTMIATGEQMQAAVYTIQAAAGDPTAQAALQYAAAEEAVAAGAFPDIATAMANITPDMATQAAVQQLTDAYGVNLCDPAVQAEFAQMDPSAFAAGNELVVGYMKVQEVVDTGFWLCVVGGILVSLTGFVGLFKALKQ